MESTEGVVLRKTEIDDAQKKKNEERLAELTRSIDMQQKKILQVRFSSTRKDEEKRDELSGALIQLRLYQEEYLDISKREYHRFSDSLELFPLGLSYKTNVRRWKPRARAFSSLGPENPISKRSMDLPPRPPSLMREASRPMERWTTLLNVWSAGRTWKRKWEHSKVIGDAKVLLDRFRKVEQTQDQVQKLRANIYQLRQKQNLNAEDLFLKRRLEEELRDTEKMRRQLMMLPGSDVHYSPPEWAWIKQLENGTTMLKHTTKGSAKPHKRFFTLDPFTGYMLWGEDRKSRIIHSALVTSVEKGIAAQLSTKHLEEPQLLYSIRYTTTRGDKRKFLYVVAYNQSQFDLWTRGVDLVISRLDLESIGEDLPSSRSSLESEN